METAYHRKKEPEQNKQLIIDAATEIGAEYDWHQVTFQAIVERTGLSKGGIIHHFRNKEELLDELMAQSLNELTAWVEQYKKKNKEKNGTFAYLQFVIDKGKDKKYRKTMRIVLQAIMVNPKYRAEWDEWYKKHIMPSDGSPLDIDSLIIKLVTDGIWYSENVGSSHLSDDDKTRILKHLRKKK